MTYRKAKRSTFLSTWLSLHRFHWHVVKLSECIQQKISGIIVHKGTAY